MESAIKKELIKDKLSSICHVCLETDRKTQDVSQDMLFAYGALSGWAPIQEVRVCWECTARLREVERFKQQVTTAKSRIEAYRNGQTMLLEPLSILSRSTLLTISCTGVGNDFSMETVSPQNVKNDPYVENNYQTNTENEFNNFVPNNIVWTEPMCVIELEKVEMDKTEDEIESKLCSEVVELDSDEDINGYGDSNTDALIYNENFEQNDEVKGDNIDQNEINNTVKHNKKTRKNIKVKNSVNINKKSPMKRAKKALNTEIKKEDDFIGIMTEVKYLTQDEWQQYREDYFKTRTSKYKCVNCIRSFHNGTVLKKHNDTYHVQSESGKRCERCSCCFNSQRQLDLHTHTHTESRVLRCLYPKCEYVHHEKKTICRHVARHREIEKDRFKTDVFVCDHCGLEWSSRKKMAQHWKNLRRDALCELCGYMAANTFVLAKHMLSHSGPELRKHGCDMCSKRFVTNYKLMLHKRTHTGERIYCKHCSVGFVDEQMLKRHVNKKHPEKLSQSEIIRARPKVARTKPLFNYKQAQSNRGRKEKPKKGKNADKVVKCLVCNINVNMYRLKYHMATHSDERPYVCAVCNKGFKRKLGLTMHEVVHSEERKFKCDVCNKAFKLSSVLYSHKLIHSGEKPHECPICNAKFTLKGNLTGHMKIHSGIKPYQCQICGKSFIWRKNLTLHLTKTHPGSEMPGLNDLSN